MGDGLWEGKAFRIDPARSLYEQYVEQIRAMIVRGELKPGTRLPSVRETAASLKVNPTTAMKTYQELERLSLLATHRGHGTFVTTDKDMIRRSKREIARNETNRMEEIAKSLDLTLIQLIALGQEKDGEEAGYI